MLRLAHHVVVIIVGTVPLVAHSLRLAMEGMHVVVAVTISGGHCCIVIVVIVVATSWSLLLLLLLIIVIVHRSVVPLTLSRSTFLDRVMLLLLLVMMIASRSMMLLLPHLIVATVVVTVVPGRSPVRLMLILVPLLLLWMNTTTSATTSSLIHLIRWVVVITPRSHPLIFGTHSPRPSVRLSVSERSATLLVRRWNRHRDIILLVRFINVSVPVIVVRVLPVIVAVPLVWFSKGRRTSRGPVALLILPGHRHCLLGVLIVRGRVVIFTRCFPHLVLLVWRRRLCPRWLSRMGDNHCNCYGWLLLLSGSIIVAGLVAKGIDGSPQETIGNQ